MNTQPHSPNDHCYCFPLDKPNQRPEDNEVKEAAHSYGLQGQRTGWRGVGSGCGVADRRHSAQLSPDFHSITGLKV